MGNRWIENFENHDFRNQLNQVFSLIEKLNKDGDSELTHSIELARLNKIANYIKELIDSCDPELFPFSHWDNLTAFFSQCVTRLNEYNVNFEGDRLKQANQLLDNALSKVVPFVKSGNEIDIASKKAFQSYSKTINEQITQTQKLLIKANQNIEKTTESIQNNLKSSKESKYKIDSFEQKLFKSEDALDPKISTFFSDISNFHKKLMQGDGTESAIKQQIQDVQKSISEEITDIRNKITVAKEEIDGLHEFYEKFLEHLAKKMKTF
jgi:sugar-specific transcriptional regulator TrmB